MEHPKEQFNKAIREEIKNLPNPNKTNNKIYKKMFQIFLVIVMRFFIKL